MYIKNINAPSEQTMFSHEETQTNLKLMKFSVQHICHTQFFLEQNSGNFGFHAKCDHYARFSVSVKVKISKLFYALSVLC